MERSIKLPQRLGINRAATRRRHSPRDTSRNIFATGNENFSRRRYRIIILLVWSITTSIECSQRQRPFVFYFLCRDRFLLRSPTLRTIFSSEKPFHLAIPPHHRHQSSARRSVCDSLYSRANTFYNKQKNS